MVNLKKDDYWAIRSSEKAHFANLASKIDRIPASCVHLCRPSIYMPTDETTKIKKQKQKADSLTADKLAGYRSSDDNK